MADNMFNEINAAWNQIKASGAPNLKAVVSGLIDPRYIFLQRAGESPTTLTLMFKGFQQALEDPEKDGPLLNRALFAWIRKSNEAQIVRGGDQDSFTVMIRKPQPQPQPQPQQPNPTPMESSSRGPLARIVSVRKING